MTDFSSDLQKIANNDPNFKNLEPSWLITDDRIQSLAAALINNTTLIGIDLYDHYIGDLNLGYLTKAIEAHKKLSSLNLDKNQITELGADYIGELIEKNDVLINLTLNNNAIGSRGAQAIARGLEVNSQLRSLHLKNTAIGDPGAQALFEALEVNTSLIFLDLSNNEINDLGASYIIQMLGHNSTISSLYLKGNPISNKNLVEIESLLSRNQKIYNIAQKAIDTIRRLPSSIPNWEEEGAFDNFNEVLKQKEQAQLEIETLFPGANLISRIEEVWAEKQIAIMLANPLYIQKSSIIGLFDSLNPKQKQSPKNQQWLESTILHYFSSIQPDSEYTHKKLLSYILQTSISADVERLMDLCLFHHFTPKVTRVMKPEPIQLVRLLINNREALKTLQKEMPGINKLVLNIITRFYKEEQSSKEIELNTQVIGLLLECPQENKETNITLNAALLRSLNIFFCADPNIANSFYSLWRHLSSENTLPIQNSATEEVAKKLLIKKYNALVLESIPNHYQNRFFIQQDVKQVKQQPAELVQEQHIELVQEQHIELVQEQHIELVQEQHIEPVQEQHIEPVQEQHIEPVQEQHIEPVQEQHIEPVQEQHLEPVQEQNSELAQEQNAVLEQEDDDEENSMLMRP
ncbi:hypothetical protein J2N86_08790 [Legionella lytica]|uniref:Uncharacterized protein n=1 Tax=Legionella lytica TaxID=96232 RepID=A0ABY4Y617_9GAMM|nr:hypothetical protein [Legionella lytica]USQ12803.1 hypothetical protein J2N86_08790 [Legionella lytica]